MKKVNILLVVSLCASGAITSPVLGSYMTYNGVGLTSHVRIDADGLLADGLSVPAGQLRIGYEGMDYLAYCVDLDHYAGSADVTEMSLDSIHNGDRVAYLFDSYADGVNSGLDAAALSVAIWEVIYETDGTFDTGSGYFSISENQDALDEANVLLGSLSSMPAEYTAVPGRTILHGEQVQDVLIPEPATIALLGLGATGMLWRERTRTRRI